MFILYLGNVSLIKCVQYETIQILVKFGFTRCKAEQQLRGMELQEKEV